jgi:endonuclease-8
MPEGDSVFRAARTLQRSLAGQRVTRFATMFPALTRVDEDRPLAGRTIESVTSRGKHLLVSFSGDLILHTHLRMNGAWHVYRPGERWRRRAIDMRVLVETASAVAVGFNIPIAEFLTARSLQRHEQLANLGPDLASQSFDAAEARRRIRELGETPIGDLLLNQRAMSGLGNVLRSEVLFVAGTDPFLLAQALSDEALDRLIETARRLMSVNVLDPERTLAAGFGRRTTNSMNPHARLWVYGRGGKPCRKCGTPIRSRKTGPDARLVYWCPSCQSPPEAGRARREHANA